MSDKWFKKVLKGKTQQKRTGPHLNPSHNPVCGLGMGARFLGVSFRRHPRNNFMLSKFAVEEHVMLKMNAIL